MQQMGGSEVGRMLHEEHEATLSILNELEGIILDRAPDQPMDVTVAEDRGHLERLIHVIDRDVQRHFAFEEEALFPILRQRGAGDMVDLLTEEHQAIRPLAGGIGIIVRDALEAGFDRASWNGFRDQVMELMERESFHIQKEEMGLIRALNVLVDAETDRQLAARYVDYAP